METAVTVDGRSHFNTVHVGVTSEGVGSVRESRSLIGKDSSISIPLTNTTLSSNTTGRDIQLVFVGDYNQLPSVGPGQILKDFISKVFILSKLATRSTLLLSNNIFFTTSISRLISMSINMIINYSSINWTYMSLPFFDIFLIF